MVPLEGTRLPEPRRIYGSEDIDTFHPTDWSPDGKSLAVRVVRKDRTSQIAIVSVQDGSFRALKTVGWRGPNKIFFSPDGKYLAYDLPASDDDVQRDVFIMTVDGSREARVVEHPAFDVAMGWSPDGSRLLFASDRTGAVGLWALPVVDGKATAAPTLLKPDIGSVSSLGLTRSGTLYIVKDASTLSLQVAPPVYRSRPSTSILASSSDLRFWRTSAASLRTGLLTDDCSSTPRPAPMVPWCSRSVRSIPAVFEWYARHSSTFHYLNGCPISDRS
jgi:hypothetical protein